MAAPLLTHALIKTNVGGGKGEKSQQKNAAKTSRIKWGNK